MKKTEWLWKHFFPSFVPSSCELREPEEQRSRQKHYSWAKNRSLKLYPSKEPCLDRHHHFSHFQCTEYTFKNKLHKKSKVEGI